MKTIYSTNTFLYLFIHGLIAILIGLIFAFASEYLFKWIVLSIGILLVLGGIIAIWMAFSENQKKLNSSKYYKLFFGIILVGIGIFISFNLTTMSNLIILIFGLWAIISGGSQMYFGIVATDTMRYNKAMIINGLLITIIGFVMAISQHFFVDFVGKIIGYSSIFLGIMTLIFSFTVYFKSQKMNKTVSKID